ncbi:MAG: hypothetical protein ACODAE_04620 [Gemmatimonadota bacterium]
MLRDARFSNDGPWLPQLVRSVASHTPVLAVDHPERATEYRAFLATLPFIALAAGDVRGSPHAGARAAECRYDTGSGGVSRVIHNPEFMSEL